VFRDASGARTANSTDNEQDGGSGAKKSDAARKQSGHILLSTAVFSIFLALLLS
jgi:hypothetical protein